VSLSIENNSRKRKEEEEEKKWGGLKNWINVNREEVW